jgi:hypothetical protein
MSENRRTGALFDPAPLTLFADDGVLRPTGVPETVVPRPGLMIRCPACGHDRFDYMSRTYGACERRACGYEWRRSGQLHHTEPLPY